MVSRLNLSQLAGLVEQEKHVEEEVQPVEQPVVNSNVIRPRITEIMIDEAVETVLGKTDLPEDVKDSFRLLLANDTDAGFAANYYMGKAKQDAYTAATRLDRKTVTLHAVVDEQEVSDLADFAPEYDLRFAQSDNHCHGPGNGMRKLETQILLDNRPQVPFKDIGGDPLVYIRSGITDAHVCDPYEDPKDPTRHVVRALVARKIYGDKSWPKQARYMAGRYLDRDPTFVCGKRAQDCKFKAKVSMSVHVYDIPMQDWPQIMHDAGSIVHSGTVHFSPKFYNTTSGVLEASRAEYEINVAEDTFTMGFRSSPSWWYRHSWMLYMRYGVDQIIEHETGRYSYKVVQRRGDTVFFEIMKVAGNSRIERQCYKLPGVRMVRVDGFDLSDKASWDMAQGKFSYLTPKVHWFPESLWKDMLTQAENDFERDVMTFDKLYGYYRFTSPRNTVNGVLLSGDNSVAMDLVVPLVVHVGLVAASRVLLGKRESRVLTAAEMHRRVQSRRSATQRIMAGFGAATQAVLGSAAGGVSWLCNKIFSLTDSMLVESLTRWAVEAEVQEVSFESLMGKASEANKMRWETYQFQPVYDMYRVIGAVSARGDHHRALAEVPHLQKLVTSLYGDRPLSGSKAWTASTVTAVETQSGVGESSKTVETERGQEEDDVPEYRPTAAQVQERRAAILESIEESELEERKITEACHTMYASCTDSLGKPMKNVLLSRAEEYGQPDFWYVNGGVLSQTSYLGNSQSGFEYSAVFHPTRDEDGLVFRTVREQALVEGGEDAVSFVLNDTSFDGWVFVFDRLTIYNGPDVRATLRSAVDLPHNYRVVLEQGPPGCGKTYKLIQAIRYGDVAMCPVRESAVDTRKRIKEKYPGFPDVRNRVGTLDSYLVNRGRKAKASLQARRLLADECFMGPSGRWYAAAALLGVKEIRAYGDEHQIPHIPRVQAPSVYLRIKAQDVETEYLTRRCPWDAVAAWGHIYGWEVRSTSSVRTSMSTAKDFRTLSMPKDLVVLVMYREGKKQARELLKMYVKEKNIRIMTVHESEGKTFEHVWMFRFDMRPRQDKMSLYDQKAHCLVGMSRHTREFVYIRPKSVGDLVDKWCAQAVDSRRVSRAGDVSTAGKSMEF